MNGSTPQPPSSGPATARARMRFGNVAAPLLAVVLLLLLVAWVVWRQAALDATLTAKPFAPPPGPATITQGDAVQRGAYLARAGHCAGCHTAPGGAPYAGGAALRTPFGPIWAGNLTPDPDTGLGRWQADDFWAALHRGRSRDGRLLSPAFPYAWTAQLARSDADDLWAYLRSLPPVHQPTPPPQLAYIVHNPAALALWQALFLRPAAAAPAPQAAPPGAPAAAWQRGAYLVEGLGHCGACHAPRSAWGAGAWQPLDGGLLPDGRSFAPSLRRADQAGVAGWALADVVALLRDGIAPQAPGAPRASGLMAEVVRGSTQHLHPDDLQAIATYLQHLPPAPTAASRAAMPPPPDTLALGQHIYDQHCADCHGAHGEGGRFGQPALAGNRALAISPPANLIGTVLRGGYGPATTGHPRPQGMPPFAHTLSDGEVAAVLSLLRHQWGGGATPVRPQDVAAQR